MQFVHLHFDADLQDYLSQARQLLAGHQSASPAAIELLHRHHPRFLDPKIPWLPLPIPDSEIRDAALTLEDAQLAIARAYNFLDWHSLAGYAAAVAGNPAVRRFESAVEAVIAGDTSTLRSLLTNDPNLVRARSTRVLNFDPPRHRATLLHYIAANGVEGYRQKSPANAVEIARILLEAGADPDALADMCGGQCTTMSLLVSSCHPAQAGAQVPLVDTLVEFGAGVNPRGVGKWTSPLLTALVFGYVDSASALVRHGARIENLVAAAGLGLIDEVRTMLPDSDEHARHRALSLAAQLGRADVVALLLDAGENPDRYNADGFHAHSTPLHQAAFAGHEPVVRLLVERGARLDIKDKIYQGTPLAWAEHGEKQSVAAYLRSRST